MEIRFSRHAKRRGSLYRIPESTVREILHQNPLSLGKHEIIKRVEGFKFPLKIVVAVEKQLMTVITNYPLKKGGKNEGKL